MKQVACGRAVRQFYKTTTLHGFKYLCSKYYSDRVGWLVCCLASACCAGVLCAVLWARFLQMPALLTLNELRFYQAAVRAPVVGVCPAAEVVANAYLARANVSVVDKTRLAPILGRVLRRKPATAEQLELLEAVLAADNATLQQFLLEHTPTCRDVLRGCRWQTVPVPCLQLFRKELTQWGVCCVLRPTKLQLPRTLTSAFETTRQLQLAMQCSNDSFLNGCEFYAKYENEEWQEPAPLKPGLNYFAQLTYVSVSDNEAGDIVDRTCSNNGHSRSHCLLRCTEVSCGCADPLGRRPPEEQALAMCTVRQLNCLRTASVDNLTCPCLPPCKKISTYIALESAPINELNYTFDELYRGMNASNGVSLSLRLRITGSRNFQVSPTETWITLLSSLGGVFNMFLGVGLFSALEFLFLIIVKLPVSIKRQSELRQPPISGR